MFLTAPPFQIKSRGTHFSYSTSNKNVVKDCGILDQLTTGDVILKDKVFATFDIMPGRTSLLARELHVNSRRSVLLQKHFRLQGAR